MKIVINTNSLLSPLTGIGQYTYQLSKKLKEIDTDNGYAYYYGFFSDELLSKVDHESTPQQSLEQYKIRTFQNVKNMVKQIPVVGKVGRELRMAFSKTLQRVNAPKFDLYFEPNFIPLEEIRTKKIVTMVFDLSVLLYPEWHPKSRVEIFEKYFQKGLKRSDIILTSTNFIKQQIIEHLKIEEFRIGVTPIDCNKEKFKLHDPEIVSSYLKKNQIPENYLMFVGSIEPRKNILGILKAYQILPEHLRKDLYLVFCGPSGWKNQSIYEFIEKNGLNNKIIFMNYITDEHLSYIYNRAKALVYPSFYEGFGLPPLEAMSSGCPAIVSDIPTHREVCGDAVLYADPHSPEQISSVIQKVLEDGSLQQSMRKKGLEQSQKFSWERTAKETIKIFRSLNGS